MPIEFNPTRSFIYVDVKKEEYRHKLHHWLYYYHIPESIAKFESFCTKYQFYDALPVPPGGENFGTVKMQLTEHHWLVDPIKAPTNINAFKEYTPIEMLKWQGTVPEDAGDVLLSGDAGRATGGDNGCPPFVFAFCPVWWEEDIKGKDRTLQDGPNYRWNFALTYPEGVTAEEGDKWLYESVFPHFADSACCTRILTSKIIREMNHCPMHRVVEMWFTGPTAWNHISVETANKIPKPFWAKEGDVFPYLKSSFEIRGAFVLDYPTCDIYSQYVGYRPRR